VTHIFKQACTRNHQDALKGKPPNYCVQSKARQLTTIFRQEQLSWQ